VDIAFDEGAMPRRLEVLDATGRVVLQRDLTVAPGRTVLTGAFDTAGLNKGLYFVAILRANGDRSVQRLVVK
jgi:hypothetical protein